MFLISIDSNLKIQQKLTNDSKIQMNICSLWISKAVLQKNNKE